MSATGSSIKCRSCCLDSGRLINMDDQDFEELASIVSIPWPEEWTAEFMSNDQISAAGRAMELLPSILDEMDTLASENRRLSALLTASETMRSGGNPKHNHPTRVILGIGQCPSCDVYHAGCHAKQALVESDEDQA